MKQTNLKKAIETILMTVLLAAMFFGNSSSAAAQFTFTGDYDKTFAAPLGYYIDGQDPDPTISEWQLSFVSGELLADGSIIAGGNFIDAGVVRGDFYLRKFTPAGAVDTSFGTNGLVRTNFFQSNNPINSDSSDFSQVF